MECENQLCKNLNKDFCYSSIACFCNNYKTHFMHVKTMSERVSYIWERSYNLTARLFDSPTARKFDSPTELWFFFTFTIQVRIATKSKFARLHKKDIKL
jgi:hypothetical protein